MRRQQKVILAAKDRIVSSDAFASLFTLSEALRDNVRTDLSLTDMRALASFARTFDDANTIRAGLSTDNVLQNGYSALTGYALWPKVEGWREVRAYAARVIRYSASLSADAGIVVVTSARRAVAGAAAVRRLGDLGLRARLELIDDDDPALTSVAAAPGEVDEEAAEFLVGYFGGTLTSSDDRSHTIVVRLGSDWTLPVTLVAPDEKPILESAAPRPAPRR
jgi:hypothetical protein